MSRTTSTRARQPLIRAETSMNRASCALISFCSTSRCFRHSSATRPSPFKLVYEQSWEDQ